MEKRIAEASSGSETCNEPKTRKVWINDTRLEKLAVNRTATGTGQNIVETGTSSPS